MNRYRLIGVFVLALGVGSTCGADQQANDDAAVAERLNIRDVALQELTLPDDAPEQLNVPVLLDGMPTQIALHKHSRRAAAFHVRVDDGETLREVAVGEPRTYTGTVIGRPGSTVAASLRRNGLHAMIRLNDDAMWFIQPADEARRNQDDEPIMHAMYRRDHVIPGDWACGLGDMEIPPQARAAGNGLPGDGARSGADAALTDIAYDADVEFFQLNNADVEETVEDIEMINNAVAAIYVAEVDINYNITEIIVRTEEEDPYDTSDYGDLLNDFADYWNNEDNPESEIPRDLAHLMTGRDLVGPVIGVAWLGVVCTSPETSYGLSQSLFSENLAARVALTAHELGHNWSANHCNGTPDCSIMCSGLGGCTGVLDEFGESATEEIIEHRDSITCTPPAPTDFDEDGMLFVPGEYESIQQAINTAIFGQEVIVEPGVYMETINLLGKPITVRALDPGSETVINGGNSGTVVTCTSGETAQTIIQGFTITGGAASDGAGMRIANASPTIQNCTFLENTAGGLGGGVHMTGGAPVFNTCTFMNNSAQSGGGAAMSNSDPLFSSCTFNGNTAMADGTGNGGAAYAVTFAEPTFSGCTFQSNSAGNRGGALHHEASIPTVSGCQFNDNSATNGGATSFTNSPGSINGCIFELNSATISGGAVYIEGKSITIAQSVFCGNTPDTITGDYTEGDLVCIVADCTDADGNGLPDACQFPPGTYIGPENGNWFNPLNWAGNQVPDPTTNVTITAPVQIPAGTAQAQFVNVIDGGALIFEGGTLNADTVVVNIGAVLSGAGVINGEVFNFGTVSPGSPAQPVGTITINGPYTQTGAGTLAVDITGEGTSDLVPIGSIASLSGTLSVNTIDISNAAMCGVFDVLTANAIEGALNPDLPEPDALTLNVVTGNDSISIHTEPGELVTIVPGSSQPEDEVGSAVAVDGLVAVVGAPAADANGEDAGAVAIYRFTSGGWEFETQLLAGDGEAGDHFGASVALHGDVLIAGAPDDLDDTKSATGSAYVYRYNGSTWTQEAKLLADDGEAGDAFGEAVAVHDDVTVIGAPGDDDHGDEAGAMYVYRRNAGAWDFEAKLLADDGVAGDRLGDAVATGADLAAGGAPHHDVGALDAGAVYTFSFNGSTWTQQDKLTTSDGAQGDRFGEAIAIDEQQMLIGAPIDTVDSVLSGSAYVFELNVDDATWNEQAKLTPSDGEHEDGFGTSVGLHNNTAVIGAPDHNIGVVNAGAAYVFKNIKSMWAEQSVLVGLNSSKDDQLGAAVDIFGPTAIIGAPNHINPSTSLDTGVAFLYLRIGEFDCNGNDVYDICDVLTGNATDGNGNGIPDACEDITACPEDFNGDLMVGVTDLLQLLGDWGPTPDSPADLDNSGDVGVNDLLQLLGAWGACE